MDFHIFDTCVRAKDVHTMHFDIMNEKKDPEKVMVVARELIFYS